MWNAEIYEQYGKERIQPSIDLVNRIRERRCERILDVGCGTGMSTAALYAAWKEAEIIGVDLSGEMLQKAREVMPFVSFYQRDCSQSLTDMGKFDLIFSNAFLQWIPNQEEFIQQSFAMLKEEGVFATQVPLFEEMPANECINEAADLFQAELKHADCAKYLMHTTLEYYDMLSACTNQTSMWVTDYCHEMESHEKILEFLKGAALRPYMEILRGEELEAFMNQVLENMKKAYPVQKNGKVIFPFRRLFMVGEKKRTK